MAPSIVWGIGIGLIIAAADTVTIVLAGRLDPQQWPIGELNMLVNIALYSLIGFKVGRATGIVRDAAEAGVMAGVLVGLVGLGVARAFPLPTADPLTMYDVIKQVASNIVYGGCLAIIAGWFGSRASKGDSMSRR